jgi:pilus assembly protein Flp/PilA
MKNSQPLSTLLRHFLRNETAATAIEYAMIAGGIGVAVAATVMALGDPVSAMYKKVSDAWPTGS